MRMRDRIKAWVEANEPLILDTNRRLIGIDSENRYPRGNELKVQLEAKRLLEQLGFATDLFTPNEVSGLTDHEAFLDDGRVYDDRPNVVGVLKGKGAGKSLLFSGHMDTVPLGDEPWDHDPFGGEVEDGKQYGLGIFDMKGGISAAIMAATCLRDLGLELEGDLLIECVVDEEFGGANGTLACRLRGYEADAAILAEPTDLAVCPANQGGAYYRVWFEGIPGRFYNEESLANPIFACGRFVEVVRRYGRWRNEQAAPPPLFEGQPLVTLIQSVHAGDARFDLSDRVPRVAYLDVWLQCWPGVSEEQLYREFAGYVEEAIRQDEIFSVIPPRIEKKMRFLPGTRIDADHPIVATLMQAGAGVREGGLPRRGAPFACDAFMFQHYSKTPAVILGPTGGNAHNANEYIRLDDFFALIEIYAVTIANWCGVRNREGTEPAVEQEGNS
jgi:acetylornithine deacetylase